MQQHVKQKQHHKLNNTALFRQCGFRKFLSIVFLWYSFLCVGVGWPQTSKQNDAPWAAVQLVFASISCRARERKSGQSELGPQIWVTNHDLSDTTRKEETRSTSAPQSLSMMSSTPGPDRVNKACLIDMWHFITEESHDGSINPNRRDTQQQEQGDAGRQAGRPGDTEGNLAAGLRGNSRPSLSFWFDFPCFTRRTVRIYLHVPLKKKHHCCGFIVSQHFSTVFFQLTFTLYFNHNRA